jgi:hypothetical protein
LNIYAEVVKTEQGFHFVQIEECNFNYVPLLLGLIQGKFFQLMPLEGKKTLTQLYLGLGRELC